MIPNQLINFQCMHAFSPKDCEKRKQKFCSEQAHNLGLLVEEHIHEKELLSSVINIILALLDQVKGLSKADPEELICLFMDFIERLLDLRLESYSYAFQFQLSCIKLITMIENNSCINDIDCNKKENFNPKTCEGQLQSSECDISNIFNKIVKVYGPEALKYLQKFFECLDKAFKILIKMKCGGNWCCCRNKRGEPCCCANKPDEHQIKDIKCALEDVDKLLEDALKQLESIKKICEDVTRKFEYLEKKLDKC